MEQRRKLITEDQLIQQADERERRFDQAIIDQLNRDNQVSALRRRLRDAVMICLGFVLGACSFWVFDAIGGLLRKLEGL